MAITDLQARQGKVDIVAEVVEKGDVREFEKFGKKGKVCDAKIKDSSGDIKLTLWNEQTELVNVGDKVHITNGYVGEWQGEKQLSTGKFGKLEVVEKSKNPPAKKPETEMVDEESFDQPVDEESIE